MMREPGGAERVPVWKLAAALAVGAVLGVMAELLAR